MKLTPIYTALVTPFDKDKSIDYTALAKLVKAQYKSGIRGFLIAGTTGEASTLSIDEKKALTIFVRSLYQDISIMVGIGNNNTQKSIEEMTIFNQVEGIDAYLCVTPYYNRPSQAGLYAHYMALDEVSNRPIILYNVPSRTGVELEAETIISLLLDGKQIVGLKHASNKLETLTLVKEMVPDAILYAGDDHALLESLYHGADGVISVVSHLTPQSIITMIEQFSLWQNLEPLDDYIKLVSKYCFIESSPSPVKYLLAKQGIIQNVLRLPLVAISKENAMLLDLLLENDALH